MISVPAHPIDLATIRTRDLPDLLGDLERLTKFDELDGEELATEHLGQQGLTTYRAVDRFVGGDPGWSDLKYWVKQFVRGSAAVFTHARRPERDRWMIRGRHRRLTGGSSEMTRRDEVWKNAYWLAFGLRDACSLALLVQTPVALVAATEAYERPMIAAIQSTFARLPGTGARLVEALTLADPEKTTKTWTGALLDLVVPVFEPLLALADHDERRFTKSLQELLELRRAYYLRDKYDEGEKWDGRDRDNLSAEAVGLIAWARALGISVSVDSGYAPEPLRDAGDCAVEACPVCGTPSDTEDPQARCHACDAPREHMLELGFAEWVTLEREPCGTCEHPFPMLVKTCPVCLTSRRGA